MASLGCEIDGLFSRTSGGMSFVEAMHGLWDIAHPAEDELFLCEQTLGVHTEVKELACDKMDLFADALPCYDTAAKHVPMGFYFHKPQSAHLGFEPAFPGAAMFNPSAPKPRRQWHDTFLPPWGPPAIVPVSIGHSAAIGLQTGVQGYWDPSKEIYFFVDHINDPRPVPELTPVLSLSYGYNNNNELAIPSGVCSSQAVIEATSKRALARPHGFVLSASGADGEKGKEGENGRKGDVGEDGYKGHSPGNGGAAGSVGGRGGSGTDGTRGTNSLKASNVILSMRGNSEELYVSGTCDAVVKLGGNKAEEILFVNCRGGNGGDGGDGGEGGSGGVGGLGGKGATGSTGYSNPNGPGSDGGPGGVGGKGGHGGTGGSGGKGGNGGHASTGGVCVLEATDPSLMMLVDADCMCGNPGVGGKGCDGGKGGIGGIGGQGGKGGRGGSGGSSTNSKGESYSYSSGRPGPSGLRGSTGDAGQRGTEGSSGRDGNVAKNGAIMWIIRSPDGGVTLTGSRWWGVAQSRYKV